VTDHPLAMLGGAVGAGYVAGGGLGAGLNGRVMRVAGVVAWRFLVLPRLERVLRGLLAAQVGSAPEAGARGI
jgi:hypothetical protein